MKSIQFENIVHENCKVHDKPISFFCRKEECKSFICMDCIENSHNDHLIYPLELFMKSLKETSLFQNQKLTQFLNSQAQELAKFKNSNAKLCAELVMQKHEKIRQINKRAQEQIDEVEAEAMNYLDIINEKYSKVIRVHTLNYKKWYDLIQNKAKILEIVTQYAEGKIKKMEFFDELKKYTLENIEDFRNIDLGKLFMTEISNFENAVAEYRNSANEMPLNLNDENKDSQESENVYDENENENLKREIEEMKLEKIQMEKDREKLHEDLQKLKKEQENYEKTNIEYINIINDCKKQISDKEAQNMKLQKNTEELNNQMQKLASQKLPEIKQEISKTKLLGIEKLKQDYINVCVHPCLLKFTTRNSSWFCNGKRLPGGCKSGYNGHSVPEGIERFRCDNCDFDLCRKCLNAYYLNTVTK